jgi:hypothetical protein
MSTMAPAGARTSPATATDRIAWCDVCAGDRVFVQPDLGGDAVLELELAAPGWACSACGAGVWLDADVSGVLAA